MCHECPFRAAAPPGWLGPLTIDDLEDACHGPKIPGTEYRSGDVGTLICHVDVSQRMARDQDEDEIELMGQQCVGMIRYVNGCLKRAHDPEVATFQDRLEEIEDKPVIAPRQLRAHHEQRWKR